MGGNDLGFVVHAELLQHFGGVFHDVPIAVAAHDDAYFCHGGLSFSLR